MLPFLISWSSGLIIFPLRLLCSPIEGEKLQNIICDGGVLVP